METNSILLILNIIMVLLNSTVMICNYYEKNYKGAILNAFALGFVSSTLLYQITNL